MPTFTSRSPSVSQGIAQFLGSSPNLTAKDYMDVERGVATIEHSRAATEKIRADLEAARAAQAFRENPNNTAGLAAAQAGVPMTQVDRQQRYLRGDVVPNLVANDDEGNPLPAAPYAPNPNITEAQRNAVNASLSTTILNQIGKLGNPAQLAQAFARQQTAGMERGASEVGVPVERQNQLNAAATGKIQAPYSAVGTTGATINQATGALNEQGSLAQEVIKNVTAQAGQRGAAAGLAGTRAADITATQPSRIARNEASARGTGRAGVKPEQITHWQQQQALNIYKAKAKEWENLGARQQKTTPKPDLGEIQKQVKADYESGRIKDTPETVLVKAMNSIAAGADPVAVKQRYKEKTGIDFPEGAGQAAAP